MKPPKKKNEPTNRNVSVTKTVYEGALPPPEMMEEYMRLDASFPNRIFKMAEKEQNHTHSMNKKAQNLAITQVATGLISGLIVMAFLCYLVYLSVNKNHPKVAITIVASMGTIVGLFIYRYKKR